MIKNLRDFVDVGTLQEIQDQFADAVGVAVIICDAKGVPLTKASNFTNFCTYIRSSTEGLHRCILSDEKVGKMALDNGKPVIHRCHSGLVDIAAPIILRKQYLGAVLCGQVLMDDEELEPLEDMKMDLDDLPLDKEKLTAYFETLEYKNNSRIKAIADLLFITSNYIVKIGDAYLTKKELINKNENFIKELQLRSLLEKTLKETQLQVLQSQINPHFLFNTLNTISRIAFFENAEQTQDVTYMLGNILRYSLRNIDQLVPLHEEIEHVRNYLFIQQTRYRNKLHFEMDISEDIKEINIPIFTLQPIFENAIVHGFEPVGEPMNITLEAYNIEEKIFLDILDDGVGIQDGETSEYPPFPPAKQKGHTTGIGLRNVDKRIKYYFGEEGGVTKVKKREKGGTLVQLVFPNNS
ncbi:PocR ligand-binding domain-containing protein [Alteribacillus sp. YIM 98480]|uniref:sensor histidine kinase n=1 Tax=Alteribacillus sp. YIM 98480 TaxID=2606599 RepID=UPI00131B0F8D|nr:PocR ligand-binding domain-containing protein [Alteribacillus sp. YIM 98480]